MGSLVNSFVDIGLLELLAGCAIPIRQCAMYTASFTRHIRGCRLMLEVVSVIFTEVHDELDVIGGCVLGILIESVLICATVNSFLHGLLQINHE